jgi:hypothetical protein
MLDEVNEKVFLTGRVTDSANAWRCCLGGMLLLALIRFGFDIDEALKQVKIAEQSFVADAVGSTRLSTRKPPDGRVVQPLALNRHRDIQLERSRRDDPHRHTFVLMEKVGKAVCLVQYFFCRYFVHRRVPV